MTHLCVILTVLPKMSWVSAGIFRCRYMRHSVQYFDDMLLLEVKYGSMFNTNMHMDTHRVGGRGNATTFPMPWQAILTELLRMEEDSERQVAPDLLKVGEGLKYVVQVLLKTNDEEKRDNLKNFAHQARVRRHVVVNWIP